MKISKKTLIIIVVAILLVAIVSIAYFLTRQKESSSTSLTPTDNNEPAFVQEFMTVEEKKGLSMSEDLRVQVIKRDESGEPMTFKIIKSDADILTTDSIPAIRPEKE